MQNSCLNTPFASRTEEIEHYAKDGSARFMEVTMTLLRDDDAKPLGVLGISRDVSERKKLEQIKTQFVTNAAHQLRGPLTSVRGYSELLLVRADMADTERQDCLKRINEEAVKLSHIVTDLVDVSRFESHQGVPLELSPTPVELALRETVELFQRRFEKHRFEIAVPEEPIVASLDTERFKEILTRILSNAAQYSPEGGLIRVVCTMDGETCQVSVQDEGLGMTAEQVGKVFDKFYRVDGSDTGVGGMGLGMTIVKHLVEWLGGAVRIDSQYGKGTTITFSVTARREPQDD